jgi:hypothetical protein
MRLIDNLHKEDNTMSTEVLDYQTFGAILAQADTLVRKSETPWTRVDALYAFMQAYPEDPAYAVAFRRLASLRTSLTKQSPPAPPPSVTDPFLAAIEKRRTEKVLTFVEASDAVQQQAPELYAQYVRDSRSPHLRGQPVTKQADLAPTYEAILKQVDAQMAQQPTLTRRAALMALLEAHPHEQAYHDAYRRFHLTDGLQAYHAAQVAKRQARP